MRNFFRSLYITPRFFIALGAVTVIFLFAYFIPTLFLFGVIGLVILQALWIIDMVQLWNSKKAVFGRRDAPERLSNGDQNEISIFLQNYYSFPVTVRVIDEIPFQFQKRDLLFKAKIEPQLKKIITYELRPVKRGEYSFGTLNVYVASPLGLARRRLRFSQDKMVPVYPSFLQMRKYELMAITSRLSEHGIKKMRRIGHSMEFEQIRDYVKGDDVRTINWKATARHGRNMVNQYQDEKSQPVYAIVDKGRLMKSPFEGLSLLDYAINSALVISNIAIRKQDKAGLITFSDKIGAIIPADRKSSQMYRIMEMLYSQKTRFLEADFERLYIHVRRRITQRSLLLLFTNFETLSSLKRQLPYLRKLSRDHLLVVIFFVNTELKTLQESKPKNTEEVYVKTIAEKFAFEKRQIVKELERHGIQSILTTPENLSVRTINKYLELKARGMI